MQGINEIWKTAKETYNHRAAQLKAKAFEITGTPTATVSQLAEYILKHPDTKQSSKTLLESTYMFYNLNKEDAQFYLETVDLSILQLDVHSKNHHLVSYRSYRDHYNLETPIKFPEELLE
ncbi:hypothetical protein [Sutcliffiella deserti]|uniref:hypothetical protein n=1 Tax=Sutcliffiella deserti TaxID=2875501 RepID=UPI001CBB4113|nr:hypothetical protein [Sutcliffiella deserti]